MVELSNFEAESEYDRYVQPGLMLQCEVKLKNANPRPIIVMGTNSSASHSGIKVTGACRPSVAESGLEAQASVVF
jgi:hypothetical protein